MWPIRLRSVSTSAFVRCFISRERPMASHPIFSEATQPTHLLVRSDWDLARDTQAGQILFEGGSSGESLRPSVAPLCDVFQSREGLACK